MNISGQTIMALALAWIAGTAVPSISMSNSDTATDKSSLATFGGGCFWCLEAVFQDLKGVHSVTNGYAGGQKDNPTYKDVCSGDTGHAEVIQIRFDPSKVTFEQLLDLFWEAHDPTTLNRQGNDVGTQYRSVVFYHDDAQRAAAEKSRTEAGKRFARPVVTRIEPLKKFYPAEAYHQGYYRNNSSAPYCQVVIRPKLEKLRSKIGKQ